MTQQRRSSRAPPAYDVGAIRRDFPILQQTVHGKPLVYLDNAASAPEAAGRDRRRARGLRALLREHPPRRAPPLRCTRPTPTRPRARRSARFLNAATRRTRSSSCAAPRRPSTSWRRRYGRRNVGAGDEVLHHRPRAPLEHRALADALRGEGRAAARSRRSTTRASSSWTSSRGCSRRARRSSPSAHVSNALGTVNPVRRIVELAHARGVRSCWSTARRRCPACPSTCSALDCDFYAFSGHKIYGPTGVGVLYGKTALLEAMPPYQGGGDMIRSVTFEKTTYNELPYKFEAGTPEHRGRASRFGAAIDYVNGLGLDAIAAHEHELLALRHRARSRTIPGCASSARRARRPACSRSCSRASTRTTSARSSTSEGIAIRTGHHCAQPVMDRFGVPGDGARLVRPLQHARRGRRASCAGIHKVAGDVPLMIRPARALPGGDPRPQQAAAELPRARRRRTAGRGLQPALRRPRDRLSRARGRRRHGRRLPGRGLRDLDRLGVDDDRERQGQDARARPRRSSSASTSSSPADPRGGQAASAELGKLAVFSGVREFPVRVKCATLRLAHAEGRPGRRGAPRSSRRSRKVPAPSPEEPEVHDERRSDARARRRGHRDPERDRHHACRAGDPVDHHPVARRQLHRHDTDQGYIVRIDGKDADAIGKEPVGPTADAAAPRGKTTEELAWDQLRTCYDPEIPVNIVDLGLVYRATSEPRGRRKQGRRQVHAHRARLRHGRRPARRTSRASCWRCRASRRPTCRSCSTRRGAQSMMSDAAKLHWG